MSCEFYLKYESGEMPESEFQSHVRACSTCQKLVEQDAQLLALAKNLRQPAGAPLLWAKIEHALRAERQRQRPSWPANFQKQKWALLRIAAVLLVAVGLGSYFLFKPQPEASRLLEGAALQQVEKKEREYVEAIAELEATALPHITKLDTELMLLYRDRLETIDAQIARCQEALAENPSNAHIRRYLLAALQDKKETLRELAQLAG
jgi:hypothetical protein